MSSGPIIIGYDGSPVADHAIREAAALLGPRPALVVVVWESGAAYETLGGGAMLAVPVDLGGAALTDQAMYEGAQHLASKGATLAAEAGFDAEGYVAADDPSVAKTLVRLAGERAPRRWSSGRADTAAWRSSCSEQHVTPGARARPLSRRGGRPARALIAGVGLRVTECASRATSSGSCSPGCGWRSATPSPR